VPCVGLPASLASDCHTPATNHLFAGDRLTISGGGSLSWKSLGSLTITNLVLDGGSIGHALDHQTGRLFGNLTVNSASSISANEDNVRIFMIYSTISGSGNLTIAMNQTNWLKQTSFLADNSGYTGKLTLRGRGKFGVCAEEGLGGNPAAFAANQITFEGTTFIATNSFTLDDPNRGITLNNTLNAGSYIYPGGVFEVNNAATVTAACVISGAGPFTKRGNGMLVLATNNTYTGQTEIVAGTLEPTVANALGTGPLLVKPAGRLLRRHPDASLPGGVALGSDVAFEEGSAVVVEFAEGFSVSGSVTVPLFTMPTVSAVDPATVPVVHGLANYKAAVFTSDAGGGRTLFSARLAYQGSIIMLK
jgi:autotransporter-associated beta strand protein